MGTSLVFKKEVTRMMMRVLELGVLEVLEVQVVEWAEARVELDRRREALLRGL